MSRRRKVVARALERLEMERRRSMGAWQRAHAAGDEAKAVAAEARHKRALMNIETKEAELAAIDQEP